MAVTLRGVTHLPYFELIGVDVVECILLLFLDCVLQVIDSFRQRDVNRKAVCFVEAENPTVERDFGSHWTQSLTCLSIFGYLPSRKQRPGLAW